MARRVIKSKLRLASSVEQLSPIAVEKSPVRHGSSAVQMPRFTWIPIRDALRRGLFSPARFMDDSSPTGDTLGIVSMAVRIRRFPATDCPERPLTRMAGRNHQVSPAHLPRSWTTLWITSGVGPARPKKSSSEAFGRVAGTLAARGESRKTVYVENV